MSVERNNGNNFKPTVQRRGESGIFGGIFKQEPASSVSSQPKTYTQSQPYTQPAKNHPQIDIKSTDGAAQKIVPNIALLGRVTGMMFVAMIFLLIMAPFFDDSGMIFGTISALLGIVWNLFFFGVFALILFPVFRKKLNVQYLWQLARQIEEIKRSGRPPTLNK